MTIDDPIKQASNFSITERTQVISLILQVDAAYHSATALGKDGFALNDETFAAVHAIVDAEYALGKYIAEHEACRALFFNRSEIQP